MTSTTTARALKDAGLVWRPTKGDRFVIPDREMDDQVFVISDLTIEAHELSTGQVLHFNGTTEWALDSVEAGEALWLPREGQLRAELGEAFAGLRRGAGPAPWEVATHRGGGLVATTAAHDAEEAYALALLAVRATTAAQLLPVAAGSLAAVLLGVSADGWERTGPDGVRTVADVVGGAVGGLGADAAASWPGALEQLLHAWTVPTDGPGDGPADVVAAARVAEAGAEGVLVDLVTATWDVARALGRDPATDPVLDPAVVRRALEHVRTWPTSQAVQVDGPLEELLVLTGRR